MKTYTGKRDPYGRVHVRVDPEDGEHHKLAHYRSHADHLDCGRASPGAADLARCLIIDALGLTPHPMGHPHPALYMAFRDQVVANLADEFALTDDEIVEWVRSFETSQTPKQRSDYDDSADEPIPESDAAGT